MLVVIIRLKAAFWPNVLIRAVQSESEHIFGLEESGEISRKLQHIYYLLYSILLYIAAFPIPFTSFIYISLQDKTISIIVFNLNY